MKIACVNGWSLSASETRIAFQDWYADAEIEVVAPAPGWEEVLEAFGSIDWLFGYSLGAFLLLSSGDRFASLARRISLLAPFEDFKREACLGGRTRKAQLSYLLKWLDREPRAAVADFRERAGLSEAGVALERSTEDLKWGIRTLRNTACESGMLSRFEGYIGECDPLLDAQRISELYSNVVVVANAGHDLKSLLRGVEGK